jgi:aspartyl-tRNA(Asn)/glutamyl-tRNA(Gln) amidotransferase subunit B
MRSPDEAKEYLTTLHSILRYIGASTANMEEGSFRCDANISVRPQGSDELGSKVEVKNMNSFRSVHAALEYETDRQIPMARDGLHIEQETRGWVEDRGITVSQRSKEYASDYRYFPEPDLPLVIIEPEWVEDVRAGLPELPGAKTARFIEQYRLSAYDAGVLTVTRATADFFESVLEARSGSHDTQQRSKSVSNWILGEVARLLNETGTELADMKITPEHLAQLLDLVEAGTLSNNMAKTVFEEMYTTGRPPKELADERGMVQLSEDESLLPAVEEAVAANEDAVADFLAGKDGAMRFLIGQVMKITRGKANPQVATKLVKEKLESLR